ncbi:MAG: glutamate 5-kinase [Kineosporiaceae bacterium]
MVSTQAPEQVRAHGREVLADAARVVVKVGSSSLTTSRGGIAAERIDALVDTLAARAARGTHVVLVSSGAVAAGRVPLGLTRRPRDLATKQAAASVGQGLLVARYTASFARYGLTVGQVLLTAEDVMRRIQYTNARRTLDRLISLGVVPVINENDAVATHEIKFGDNDRLAALVAHLVGADALVLLSDVDALYDGPPTRPGARRVPLVRGEEDLHGVEIGTIGAAGVGSGGMATKLLAAATASAAGIPTLLTSTANAAAALAGQDVGTWFTATGGHVPQRMLWLAHAAVGSGRLVLDPGAVAAVVTRRMSLLPAGVVRAEGRFAAGDPVDLVDGEGVVWARGLVNFGSAELPRLLGRSTRDLARELGPRYERELVHRDDLVVLPRWVAAV